MTRRERIAFTLVFFGTLAVYAVGWALTVDQIWNNVYDSVNQAIRWNVVAHV